MRLVGILLLAAMAVGQSGRLYVTELGRRVLAQSDQIVEAKVASVRPPFRGISTARLEVAERFHGYDRSEELILIFIDDYLAPDAFSATLERSTVRYERKRKAGLLNRLGGRTEDEATNSREVTRSRESLPTRRGRGVGVRLAAGEEGLFFLRRKGASYSLVGYVPLRDPLYKAKRQRLADVQRIEAIGAVDTRARNAKRFFIGGLKSRDDWERGNSAREIRALALRYPEVFEEADVKTLARALYGETEPPILAALEGAVRELDPDLAVAYAEAEEERSRQRWATALAAERKMLEATKLPELRAADVVRVAQRYGRAATGVVAEYLRDEAPIVRERAAQALAELGGPSARAPLREALRAERDPDAAMAMIYACGVKADPDAVPAIVPRLTDRALERPALHALARIGGKAAQTALEQHRRRADPATVELIDTLLREEFAERS